MINDIYSKKKVVSSWFHLLHQVICYEYEKIEFDFAKKNNKKPASFEVKNWKKSIFKNSGGGTFSKIKNGNVFDSVGVNVSEVLGKFDKRFKSEIYGAKKNPSYWASGISVVAHMKNPKIPALHFNTRFICTSKSWFGGGIDATPSFKDNNEARKFHNEIKTMCDRHKVDYKKYKKWCDDYFYLPHRNESRGIGGIFFDYKQGNWEKDFNFIRDLGLCFVKCSKSIIKNKIYKKWNIKQKNDQFYKRSRYVEFNLLYDRGTKFGLNTGGNVEAILMSLPPTAKWK